MSRPFVLLVLLTVVSGGVAGGAGATTSAENVAIVAVYPNPVAEDDVGEFVTLTVPPATDLTGWTISDGETSLRLPNVTVSGRVVLTTAPETARNLTDEPVYALEGRLALANSGETLTVRAGHDVMAQCHYEDAPEGARGVTQNGTVTWKPLETTAFEVRSGGGGTVQPFVLPDAGGTPVEVLRSADDRILLAGYTFTSRRATAALIAANDRGVDVRVLLEGDPVGGMSRRQAQLLDRLVTAGVSVQVIDGPYARVEHHHAKYAVVDDRALVLTENWKPAGTGGASSRGWGVVLTQGELVDALARTFRADATWRDAIGWRQFREGESFVTTPRANGSFRTRYRPGRYRANATALLVAPDNAEQAVIDRLNAAERSIDVVQVGVGGPNQSFVRALKRAAMRGVEVRVLLSRAWYAREENRAIETRLTSWARHRDAPLSVRLARPRDRFGKIHAKGAIVDGNLTLLGSLNWNDHSARENREVVLAIDGTGPAGYYKRVFTGDWRAAVWRVTVGLGGVVLAATLLALLVGRRIEFVYPEERLGR